uniref:Extradiol ring-cleavage dioxygenase class III enzyme subunit B domain-containing protein n=1 Tax=Chromera velia CCMP2878 TaxID=1169474 RepID=A0A0G4FX68_9ALVE|eukprot:Cvel_3867.t1-p1 / transcript=Cvel_3867.t1 / gene=Cvel_3867 / organism=Chromera_velia_CCMP2878 / gene_product=hypothetical protein / transcript_product=hypothetical protein / location=Cvel_scaffold163:113839-115323(+) / protein_length=495 / sequence_SO=supercontig / SO=protein_coding / is_pseudo=false
MKRGLFCFVTAFTLFLKQKGVDGKIVGALILPHGEEALFPELADSSGGSRELQRASLEVSRKWKFNPSKSALNSISAINGIEEERDEREVDVVFLVTPHGLELSDDYLLYLNSHLSGSVDLQNPLYPHRAPKRVELEARTDVPLAEEILRLLGRRAWKQKEKGKTENERKSPPYDLQGLNGFVGFGDAKKVLQLDQGEIIPLSFLFSQTQAEREKQTHTYTAEKASAPLFVEDVESTSAAQPPVVILSIPSSRYSHTGRVDDEMISELLNLGGDVGGVLEQSDRRVLWVVSADLAHTHLSEGPYGLSEFAQPFDRAVEEWAEGGGRQKLLGEAAELHNAGAAACGFTGLVLLQGMFDRVCSSVTRSDNQISEKGERDSACLSTSGATEWESRVLGNFHPTYYGMLVAEMKRKRKNDAMNVRNPRTQTEEEGEKDVFARSEGLSAHFEKEPAEDNSFGFGGFELKGQREEKENIRTKFSNEIVHSSPSSLPSLRYS